MGRLKSYAFACQGALLSFEHFHCFCSRTMSTVGSAVCAPRAGLHQRMRRSESWRRVCVEMRRRTDEHGQSTQWSELELVSVSRRRLVSAYHGAEVQRCVKQLPFCCGLILHEPCKSCGSHHIIRREEGVSVEICW